MKNSKDLRISDSENSKCLQSEPVELDQKMLQHTEGLASLECVD